VLWVTVVTAVGKTWLGRIEFDGERTSLAALLGSTGSIIAGNICPTPALI
jgi:hypothetical protein